LKILIFGKTGQVSWELQRNVTLLGEVHCVGRPELELADVATLRDFIRQLRPNVLINAAAYTAVDQAESEPAAAAQINAVAPRIMAEEMKGIGGLLVHYSTDFVYDGVKKGSYIETDRTSPLNAYGTSKLAGDQAIIAAAGKFVILRTSWVYGARGRNFMKTILRLAASRKPLRVVDDQVGSPTWSRDIATATAHIIAELSEPTSNGSRRLKDSDNKLNGVYHLSASGETSWFGFACAILEESRKMRRLDESVPISPIVSSEYPTPASRPHNSVLSNEKLRLSFGISLPPWRESLKKALEELSQTAG